MSASVVTSMFKDVCSSAPPSGQKHKHLKLHSISHYSQIPDPLSSRLCKQQYRRDPVTCAKTCSEKKISVYSFPHPFSIPSHQKSTYIQATVMHSSSTSSNWILMSCQPHRVTSGQSITQGHLRTVNHTGSPQDSQTRVTGKYAFLNSSQIYIYKYINPLSSQSTKPITSQT